LQDQIIELAEQWLGWQTMHIRPARTKHGWKTPVQGALGKGWPDLVMLRGGRIIAAEMKTDKGKVTPEQADVIGLLQAAGVETYIWRPKYWDDIVEVLR